MHAHNLKRIRMRIVFIGLLCLSVVCMVPLMGSYHLTSDHLHHDASVPCSTCMGMTATTSIGFLLTLFGLLSLLISAAPLLTLIADQFHPPRRMH